MKSFRFSRKQLSIPYVLFLICFVLIPMFIILYYACTDAEGHFSFVNLVTFFQSKAKIVDLIRSFLLAFVNTALCLLIAYPLALILSNKKYNKSYIIVLMFLMPMWINFVLRTAATRDLLRWIGIDGGIYPYTASIIGLVYNYLPFMMLPLYSTMLKMDKNLIEASADLGAKPHQTFFKTIIPMTMPGIISGCTMVFMPTMSSYVIMNIMSENKIAILGNLIEDSFNLSSWNSGSFVALIMLLIIAITSFLTRNMEKDDSVRGGIW